jgi:phage N-6-adenine-methyltransferase
METNQDIGTDPEFFSVANQEFHFVVDLAATNENKKCQFFFGKGETDNESKGGSLSLPWRTLHGWLWLNPPFRDITPWAKKCWEESQQGARVAMLVPASVDSNWFEDWVWGKAEIRWLQGRMVFEYIHQKDGGIDKKTKKPRYLAGEVNRDIYPKPLMLCVFERGRFPLARPWRWKDAIPPRRHG